MSVPCGVNPSEPVSGADVDVSLLHIRLIYLCAVSFQLQAVLHLALRYFPLDDTLLTRALRMAEKSGKPQRMRKIMALTAGENTEKSKKMMLEGEEAQLCGILSSLFSSISNTLHFCCYNFIPI